MESRLSLCQLISLKCHLTSPDLRSSEHAAGHHRHPGVGPGHPQTPHPPLLTSSTYPHPPPITSPTTSPTTRHLTSLSQSASAYCSSLAHKTNHSFLPNGETSRTSSPHRLHRPVCRVRPPQVRSHPLHLHHSRYRGGRGGEEHLILENSFLAQPSPPHPILTSSPPLTLARSW